MARRAIEKCKICSEEQIHHRSKSNKNTTSITAKKELKNYFIPFNSSPLFPSNIITKSFQGVLEKKQ
jgi:hypothetical protein